MINPILEKQVADCREIRDQWHKFRDLFNSAINQQEPITQEKEMEFLKVKSAIAMLFDGYLDAIRSGQKIAQNVMTIVSRSITLKHVADLSLAESKKFEIEWHEAFLQMEETVTQLEEESKRLAQISGAAHMRRQMAARVTGALSGGVRSTGFKMGVILAIVLGLLGSAIYFDVGERLYANPNTRPWGVLVFNAMRALQPDMEFRSLVDEKVVPETLPRNKPGGWGDIQKVPEHEINKTQAAQVVQFESGSARFDGSADLMRAQEIAAHKFEVMFDQRRMEMFILVFRMGTTDEAKQFMANFQRYMDQRAEADRQSYGDDPGMRISLFRKANLIVVTRCNEKSARTWVRRNLFGVSQPGD